MRTTDRPGELVAELGHTTGDHVDERNELGFEPDRSSVAKSRTLFRLIGPPSGSVDTRATIADHRSGPAAEPNQNRGIDPVVLNGRTAGTERFLGHTDNTVSSLRGNADAVPIPKSCLAPPRRRSWTYEPSRRRRAVERG